MNKARFEQLISSRRTGHLTEAFSLALDAIRQHRFQSSLTLAGIIMGVATVIVVVALIQGLDGTIKRALSRLNPSSFIVGRMGFSDMGNPDFQALLKRRPPLTVDDAMDIREKLSSVRVVSPFYARMPFESLRVWYQREEAQGPIMRASSCFFTDATGIMERGRFISDVIRPIAATCCPRPHDCGRTVRHRRPSRQDGSH
jgi:hypothetical protein